MKMIQNALGVAALIFSTVAGAQTSQVDPATSSLQWKGAKVIGDSHTGNIAIKSGEITYGKDGPASAVIVVDMKSITNTDLKDAEYNKKLITHLKSDDFFSVEKHPEAKLTIKKFTKVTGDEFKLDGELSIKGIVKPVSLKAKVSQEKQEISKITADLEFDRTEFEVRYGSGKFFQGLGDKVIADKVEVKVELKGKPSSNLGRI
jgi:polyisoprenoid-binding protein YceI